MTTELLAIEPLPGADRIRFSLDGPALGERREGEAIEIDGWALGLDQPVAAVLVIADGSPCSRIEVCRERSDVGAAHPSLPWAARCGFRGWAPASGHDDGFSLTLAAEFATGETVPFAAVSFRRVEEDWSHLPPAGDWAGPDFIIIGAMRSGSTSLFSYLAQHPSMAPSATKELHYFSHRHARPWDWYRSRFPTSPAPGKLAFEATPYYLFHPHAPARIARMAPNAKLIAVLRNPVDRAHSHYFHERALGVELLSFEDALAAENDRIAAESARIADDPGYNSFAHQSYSYLSRGRYADQLRRWFASFPRDRMLILRSEDLYADPGSVLGEVTSFLGVAPLQLPGHAAHNQRDYPGMAPETRRALETWFREPNEDLAELIGRDMGWDSGSGAHQERG